MPCRTAFERGQSLGNRSEGGTFKGFRAIRKHFRSGSLGEFHPIDHHLPCAVVIVRRRGNNKGGGKQRQSDNEIISFKAAERAGNRCFRASPEPPVADAAIRCDQQVHLRCGPLPGVICLVGRNRFATTDQNDREEQNPAARRKVPLESSAGSPEAAPGAAGRCLCWKVGHGGALPGNAGALPNGLSVRKKRVIVAQPSCENKQTSPAANPERTNRSEFSHDQKHLLRSAAKCR